MEKKIIYEGYEELFQKHEKRVAGVLVEYFDSDIILQKKYYTKMADCYIVKTGAMWEIKSPIGNGKRTIDNNLRSAEKQANNVVLDLSRCKMKDVQAIARTRNFLLRERNNIKKLKIITKTREVIDIL